MKFNNLRNRLLWMSAGLSLFFQSAFSATITVNSPFDSVAGSLRNALSPLPTSDTIKFNITGTDTVVLKNQIVINGAKVISGINSSTGNKIVIQVLNPGVSPYRVFQINNGTTSPAVIHDAVLRGGRLAHDDGGVILMAGDLSLDNVTVSNGVVDSGSGGGICSMSGKLVINHSTIINNTVKIYISGSGSGITAKGGGIYAYTGRMVITNSTIANNTTLATKTRANGYSPVASEGGGICFYEGYLQIENCTVINNSANIKTENQPMDGSAKGGGIYTYEGYMAIAHCTIINNSCTVDDQTNIPIFGGQNYGGGVYTYEPTIGIVNSIIVGNSVRMGTQTRTDDVREFLWDLKQGRVLNSIVDSAVNVTLTNCLVHQPMQQIFGTATPVLEDNGGPTKTILLPANSIAAGAGIKSGVFQRDTAIDGKSSTNPTIAYFNGSNWIGLNNDLQVPAGKTVTPIPLDQRGQTRVLPPFIGSVENTTALGVPVTISPLDGADGIALNPTLKWLLSQNALSYRIQVSTHSGFNDIVIDKAGITDTIFGLSGLSKGIKYYWRVNATYPGGTGNWCMPSCFSTVADPPDIPVICSPLSTSTNLPVTTALVWHPALRAASYRVQVSLKSDFSTLFKDTSGITDTSFSPAGLTNETRYYWCVCATNSGGTSAWMQTAYFNTAMAVPSIPKLVSPVSGVLTPVTPTFKWNASSGAATYRVQVSLTPSFTSILKDSALIADTSLVLKSLSNDLKYYWRVNATNGGGTSAWSTVENFTTNPLSPDIPALCSPVSGATNQPLTTTLIWHSVSTALSYRIQVSQNADFSTLFKDTSGIIDTTLILAGLTNGTRYYWCVKAFNAGGSSGWMPTAYFTVTADIPMSTVLISPENGSIIQTDSVQLVWKTGATEAMQYMVEVATDSAMSHLFFVDSTIKDTTTSIKVFSNGLVCWWHVRTRNAAGWGPFSLKRSFKISATAILPKQTLLQEFRLNGTSGVLAYCLAERCFVNLSIFDLKGKLIGSFINSMQNPGWYRLETPTLNLSRGLYVQRFSAGRFKCRRNLAIVR